MSLGLSHSLSRYKLKFSPDKVRRTLTSLGSNGEELPKWRFLTDCLDQLVLQVDTMIVQAIGLLDDLDKELNTYAMRVREWYGWHFPEMTKIITDNITYAKVVSS